MSHPADLFEIPAPGPYLLAHSVGCLPVAARMVVEDRLFAPWAAKGSDGWDDWLTVIDRFRRGIAGLIGADAAQICPQPSNSAALTSLLSGVPRPPGRYRLLLSRHAFPSIGFALGAFERFGYRLDLIDGDPSDIETWRSAIAEDVAMVVAMHVHSNSGRVSPVAEIAQAAKAAGALTVVDVAQSIGLLPVDVRAWQVDAIIGSCVKWLCGGPGAAFLWASPTLVETAQPLDIGWFSHADPFAFVIDDFRPAPDARRFWGGTPSIAPYAIALAGIETITALGTNNILADNRRLIARFADSAAADVDMLGRGGTLCLTTEKPDDLTAALAAASIRFDRRGDVLRLSFHSWNRDEDADLAGSIARDFPICLA